MKIIKFCLKIYDLLRHLHLWVGVWVNGLELGQMTNLIKLELINIIWFCLKIYNLSRHPYLWVDGCVNGWAHVKPLKSNKSWPNRDNSIMDILDILLDILLKPPQPLMGLFLLYAITAVVLLLIKSFQYQRVFNGIVDAFQDSKWTGLKSNQGFTTNRKPSSDFPIQKIWMKE